MARTTATGAQGIALNALRDMLVTGNTALTAWGVAETFTVTEHVWEYESDDSATSPIIVISDDPEGGDFGLVPLTQIGRGTFVIYFVWDVPEALLDANNEVTGAFSAPTSNQREAFVRLLNYAEAILQELVSDSMSSGLPNISYEKMEGPGIVRERTGADVPQVKVVYRLSYGLEDGI